MPNEKLQAQLQQTQKSLSRIQDFDVDSLPREVELGQQLNFEEVVEPAKRLVELYKRLSPTALEDFPLSGLQGILNQANSDFNFFNQILEFNSTVNNTAQQRLQLIQQVENAYDPTFKILNQYISYSLHRAADFQRLDRDARATFQQIRDEAEVITKDLQATKEKTQRILEDVRNVAAEQGVTQQAVYFKDEAADHEKQASKWRNATISISIGLAVYSFASIFFHKVPWIAPSNTYETVQIAVSKVLVFGVISYMLYLCARNFLSHKHNSIVNRHRQNALMTYKALVDAAGETANRDVVLNQAAVCIFGAQTTGYTSSGDAQGPSAKTVVELLRRPSPE